MTPKEYTRFYVTITYQVDAENHDQAFAMAHHDAAIAGNVVDGFSAVDSVHPDFEYKPGKVEQS
jgi:hypothetical protein